MGHKYSILPTDEEDKDIINIKLMQAQEKHKIAVQKYIENKTNENAVKLTITREELDKYHKKMKTLEK